MLKKQRGITLIGWVFLLTPMALVVFSIIRVAPMYLNYTRVARSITQVASEVGGDASIPMQQIRNALEKRFDIESIEFPDVKDVVIRREGKAWVIEAKYEETAPLFYNVGLLLSFDKSARVGDSND